MNIRDLHDDLLFMLAKHLDPRDCLSLALSAVNERFSFLYGSNRKRLAITECYFLRGKPWRTFFSQYIDPSLICTFDVSHVYWLRARTICKSVIQMQNLEELLIQDTKMSLKKMPKVFLACQKIRKLSLTLKEDSLNHFRKNLIGKEPMKWMKKGFQRITHLKLFTFVVPSHDDGYNNNAWLAVLGVLKWCSDLIELLIKITFGSDQNADEKEDVFVGLEGYEKLWKKLKPRFGWMKTLKSLVILGTDSFNDRFTREFLEWVKEMQGGWFDLERLWITGEATRIYFGEVSLIDQLNRRSAVKSILMCYDYWENSDNNLGHESFRKLEHLADIEFDRFEHQTELKYLRGESIVAFVLFKLSTYLNDIFECHKKMEQLHFYLIEDDEDEQYILNFGDWDLPLLKDLFIWCDIKPDQRVLDHLFNACANIDQVHFRFGVPLSKAEMTSFSNSIRFNRLTWLTINVTDLSDGSYLVSIVKNCPNLERLFLNGNIEANTFFLNISECFQTARHLRDLRVQWPSLQEDLSQLPAFFKALKRCPTLERLVLYAVKDNWERDPVYYAPLQEAILPFVKGMLHLVALCLAGLPIDEDVVENQLMSEIVPNRPAFWFHLGPYLPIESDLSVPRIHYDGIVDPKDPYNAPPRF